MFSAIALTLLVASLAILPCHVKAGPPCTSDRPTALCAWHIRPYSDNAYTWDNVCDFSAPSTALIADNVEMYDYGYNCSSMYVATCCARFSGCSNGIDCDGPETALPVPYTGNDVELAFNWVTAVPCAVDNADRVLTNTIVTYLQSNTPYNCALSCFSKGYQYAGVEYGDECYCGTGYVGGVLPQAADLSECDMTCPGSYYFNCGGSWRMQIYKAPGAP
ncbi:hypothetical protein BC835DRAFT_1306520 [Cytidiella melzeri]|nr:hypothetical protein BC835DRAFT_1306520 [Cytidiella melzeri]